MASFRRKRATNGKFAAHLAGASRHHDKFSGFSNVTDSWLFCRIAARPIG
jgi:hypothetical protein